MRTISSWNLALAALAMPLAALFLTPQPASAQPWKDPRFEVDVRFPPPEPSAIVMPAAATHPQQALWRYSFTPPGPAWMTEGFDHSSWPVGSAGFGQFCCADPLLDQEQTLWPTTQIWMRRTFTLSDPNADIAVWGRWDDGIEVYINGVAAFSSPHWSAVYRYGPLSDEARKTLRAGVNLIAVSVVDTGGGRYADVGLALNPMANLPSSGYHVNPALDVFHEKAAQFFERNIIPAAGVAIMKRDTIVFNRGYGYMDKHGTTPLPSNAVFRLASLDKPPGWAAARRLIDDRFVDPVTGTLLTLDTPVMPLLVARGLEPLPGHTPDPNINLVTIGHIIKHQSGMSELSWAQDMLNQTGTPLGQYTSHDNVRYVYSKPLAFVPGAGNAYCSSCAMVLRHLVDVLTGGFESYFVNTVMDGYGEDGLRIVHEPLALRDPLEPWYETWEMPYEREIYLDHYFALTATAEAYARFLRGYNLESGHRLIDPETGLWAPVPDNGGTGGGGAMSGTRTVAIQRRWDEVTIVIFSNSNTACDSLAWEFELMVNELPDSAWECLADPNCDGVVNIDDLFAVVTAWGPCPAPPAECASDLDDDGDVDIDDLFIVLGNWS